MPFGRFDVAVLGLSLIALAVWIANPTRTYTGALTLAAGVAHAVRLGRWAGDRSLRDRLVLVLHVGYAFVPLGFLLVAGAILYPQAVPVSAGIHAWTVGAIGTMTLAMMTRASLGHAGQELAAGPLTQAIYVAVLLAAFLRIAAAFGSGVAALAAGVRRRCLDRRVLVLRGRIWSAVVTAAQGRALRARSVLEKTFLFDDWSRICRAPSRPRRAVIAAQIGRMSPSAAEIMSEGQWLGR